MPRGIVKSGLEGHAGSRQMGTPRRSSRLGSVAVGSAVTIVTSTPAAARRGATSSTCVWTPPVDG
jgi:hypothetical protein